MHEGSYAQMIISSVLDFLKNKNLENVRVKKIKMRIGELSLIDIEALKNAMEIYSIGTPLEGAQLEVELVKSEFKCRNCGAQWSFRDVYPDLEVNLPILHLYPHLISEILKCPRCGSSDVEIVKGEEFQIVSIEIENAGEEKANLKGSTPTNYRGDAK
ncbi:hydrogenase nickel incorporation protein HypA [Ignicoccus islandicus DSM 13165]|uniref:Hydrogenase maturation factor HypA n=1 Tax=Ignicoccus islandicus DSM 13165 TaxID=940295 RepID=A0A0U3FP86_9CREN|nr:hydrogenase maturation nickel metallochaperone HypA [Ignicoccus islandicus]ALU11783.1 hydrogenase nickel incorporation protein HypA [Ignicoccus islandicus DSM 13165]